MAIKNIEHWSDIAWVMKCLGPPQFKRGCRKRKHCYILQLFSELNLIQGFELIRIPGSLKCQARSLWPQQCKDSLPLRAQVLHKEQTMICTVWDLYPTEFNFFKTERWLHFDVLTLIYFFFQIIEKVSTIFAI